MPADPQILKVVIFTLDSEDFAADIVSGKVVPVPGAIQTVKTLDGVTHQDAESESWQLELTAVADFDSARPGLAYYLLTNKGAKVDFTFKDTTAANSAAKPLISGECTLVAMPYGGDGQVFAQHDIVLPITGTPVLDPTP